MPGGRSSHGEGWEGGLPGGTGGGCKWRGKACRGVSPAGALLLSCSPWGEEQEQQEQQGWTPASGATGSCSACRRAVDLPGKQRAA